MKNLGFDTSRVSPSVLWNLIDYDNSGFIDIEEFAEALMKLHGAANAIDIARLRHDTAKLSRVVSAAQVLWDANFQELRESLQTVKDELYMRPGARSLGRLFKEAQNPPARSGSDRLEI